MTTKLDLKKMRDDWCNGCNLMKCNMSTCLPEYLNICNTIALQEIAKSLEILTNPMSAINPDNIKEIVKMTNEEINKMKTKAPDETD